MHYRVQGACVCHMGRVRGNNEDNFFFDGQCMDAKNLGLSKPLVMEANCPVRLAVFDGMGGANYGEIAAYTAAKEMQSIKHSPMSWLFPMEKRQNALVCRLNQGVLQASERMPCSGMGTTMAMLDLAAGSCFCCNVGDSRIYCLRDGKFRQLSTDHVSLSPGKNGGKPGLTQCLGLDPGLAQLSPTHGKGRLCRGDMFLLCTDGLTDMLDDGQIREILISERLVQCAASELLRAALEKGGRDNITAIVCKIDAEGGE